MFKTVALSLPGALRPETRQALINTSVRYIAEELQAMPGVLKEMDPRQRGQLRRALELAVGAIDVHDDAQNGLNVSELDQLARLAGVVA